jgi:AcrR family transcriptional regulator
MQNTKHKIQTQLLSMMETSDLHTIKVSRLTDVLGIGRGTFYMYYDSIYDVLQEIEDKFFAELQEVGSDFYTLPFNSRYNHEPHPDILQALQFLHKNDYLCRLLWGPHGCASFQARCKKMIRKRFFPKVLQHELSDNYSELKITSFVAGHSELVTHWLSCYSDLAAEQVAVLVHQMMFSIFSGNCEAGGSKF